MLGWLSLMLFARNARVHGRLFVHIPTGKNIVCGWGNVTYVPL